MSKDLEHRRELVATLEAQRKSKVITLFLADRPGLAARFDASTVRTLYDHLRPLGHVPRLDLFLHAAGGELDVPWRIVSLLREHADRVEVLVAAKAMSAATLVCLGADALVLSAKAELGAFDPQIGVVRGDGSEEIEEQIAVEDIMAFVRFMRRRTGVSEAGALAAPLTEELPTWLLGQTERAHAQVRRLARRIMRSRTPPPDAQTVRRIIREMAGRNRPHGDAIVRGEARALGLPVVEPAPATDAAMWTLHEAYERLCRIREPFDPRAVLAEDELSRDEPVVLGVIESSGLTHELAAEVRVSRRRATPERLDLTVNVGTAEDETRLRRALLDAMRPHLYSSEVDMCVIGQRWTLHGDAATHAADRDDRETPHLRHRGARG
jgi:hypothetical protein